MTPLTPYVARLLVDARQRDLLDAAPARRHRLHRPRSWLQWRPLPPTWGGRAAGAPTAGAPPAAPCRA